MTGAMTLAEGDTQADKLLHGDEQRVWGDAG